MHRPIIGRRPVIAALVVEVVLFVIANVTAKSSSSPGAVSQVAWAVFLVGIVLLIALGVAAWVTSRRRNHSAAGLSR
ncbi:MAG TPA: hypothetical protein VIJ20_06000 [Solirubrobacteraceae bacterium]